MTSSHPMTSRDITRLLDTSRGFAVRDFTWMNPKGDAVYSSNPAMIGRNYGDRSYFCEVVNGREWMVSELIIAKTTGETGLWHLPRHSGRKGQSARRCFCR